jgi:hypothetical protein
MRFDDVRFVFFTADEGVGEIVFKESASAIDHFRYLIADRAGDRSRLKELRRLRGEPEGDADVERAPWLIAIYLEIIRWLAEAKPGDLFKANGGGTYWIFCIDSETLFDPVSRLGLG